MTLETIGKIAASSEWWEPLVGLLGVIVVFGSWPMCWEIRFAWRCWKERRRANR